MNRFFCALLFGVVGGMGGESTAALASEDCSAFDLRQTTFKNVPVMDQDGMAFCYGYAAAGMVDAWRFTHGDQRRDHLTSGAEAVITLGATVSEAADPSVIYRKQFLDHLKSKGISQASENDLIRIAAITSSQSQFGNSSFTKSLEVVDGSACAVAESIQKNGSCNARSLAYAKGGMDFDGDDSALSSWIYTLSAQYDGYHAYHDLQKQVTRVQGEAMREAHVRNSCQTSDHYGLLTDLTASNMQVMKVALKQENPMYFLKTMVDPSCKGTNRISVPPFECKRTNMLYSSTAEFSDALTRNLKGGMPVEVDICSGFLKQGPRYKNVIMGADDSGSIVKGCPKDEKGDSDAHAVLVVGRRIDPKQPGKCQVLIRNSWGSGCESYRWCEATDGKVSALSSSNGLSIAAPKGRVQCVKGALKQWECADGHIWVDLDTVNANLTDYREFTKK